jgi:DNA invertase Pin-like site-specific DNA recombinase
MCGVFAEFERAMIVERVRAGLKRAKAKGAARTVASAWRQQLSARYSPRDRKGVVSPTLSVARAPHQEIVRRFLSLVLVLAAAGDIPGSDSTSDGHVRAAF